MKPEIKTKGIAGNIDLFIGQKIYQLRQLLGMSQEKLAEEMDITFQQIQKYEKGKNRMSAARLYDASKILNVSVEFFFDGYEQKPNGDLSQILSNVVKDGMPILQKINNIKNKKSRVAAVKACHQILNMLQDR